MKAVVLFNSKKKSLFSMSVMPLEGFIMFTQPSINDKVKVSIYLSGLPNGLHGFHIHEKGMESLGNCPDVKECCKLLGGHFSVRPAWSLNNLDGVKHGFHNGDLCFNILSDEGICEHVFEKDNISLYPESPEYIVGRSIVIHADEDDQGLAYYEDPEKNIESYITGNAGERIACGEIRNMKNIKL